MVDIKDLQQSMNELLTQVKQINEQTRRYLIDIKKQLSSKCTIDEYHCHVYEGINRMKKCIPFIENCSEHYFSNCIHSHGVCHDGCECLHDRD